MAYIQNQNQQDEEQAQPIGGGSQGVANTSQGGAAAAPVTGGQLQNKGSSGGGRFANFQKILNKNQESGTGIANQISKKQDQINQPFTQNVAQQQQRIGDESQVEVNRLNAGKQIIEKAAVNPYDLVSRQALNDEAVRREAAAKVQQADSIKSYDTAIKSKSAYEEQGKRLNKEVEDFNRTLYRGQRNDYIQQSNRAANLLQNKVNEYRNSGEVDVINRQLRTSSIDKSLAASELKKFQEMALNPDVPAEQRQAAMAEFTKLRDNQTTTAQVQNQDSLQNTLDKIQRKSSLSNSEKGRFQLLQETFNNPARNVGISSLDQAILQSNPETLQALKNNLTQTATQSNNRFQGLLGTQRDSANQVTGLGTQRANEVQDIVGGALTQDTTALDNEVLRQKQSGKEVREDVLGKLAGGESLSVGDIYALGINPNDTAAIAKLNDIKNAKSPASAKMAFENVVGPYNPQSIVADRVAGVEQASRINSLNELLARNPRLNLRDAATTIESSGVGRNLKSDEAVAIGPQAALKRDFYMPAINNNNWFRRAFCHLNGTQVLMQDMTYQAIETIKIGDYVHLGGMVGGVGQALASEIYDYFGSKVTGSHAVLEGDTWIRVEDSDFAELQEGSQFMVCPILVENHIYVTIEDIVFADMAELDNTYQYNDSQRIEVLNQDVKRNQSLQFEVTQIQSSSICYAV